MDVHRRASELLSFPIDRFGLFLKGAELDLSLPVRRSGVGNGEVEVRELGDDDVANRMGKVALRARGGERREGVVRLWATTLWAMLMKLEKVSMLRGREGVSGGEGDREEEMKRKGRKEERVRKTETYQKRWRRECQEWGKGDSCCLRIFANMIFNFQFHRQFAGELTLEPSRDKENFSIPRLRWMTWSSSGGIRDLLGVTLADIGFRSGSAAFELTWDVTTLRTSEILSEIEVVDLCVFLGGEGSFVISDISEYSSIGGREKNK